MSALVRMSVDEVAELLAIVRGRDARTAVRRAEDILSDAGLMIFMAGPDSPDNPTDLQGVHMPDSRTTVGPPPNIHPEVDLDNIRRLEPDARALSASTYMRTLDRWVEETREVRNAAVVELLRQGLSVSDVAERTGVGLSTVKGLNAYRKLSGT